MLVFDTPPEWFESKIETVGIFCCYQDTLLHLLRQDNKPEGNKRSWPGGKVDLEDVTPAAAMKRELEEEAGIFLTVDELEHIKTYYVRYPNMDFVYHKYRRVFETKPEIQLREKEHKAYDRFTPQEALAHTLLLGEDEVIRDIYNIQ